MPTCLLVRHGRTTANASGTLAGWTPGVGLDDVGFAQTERLAQRLAGLPIVALVSSPLQRCLETARTLSAVGGLDVAPQVVEGLGECRYGSWTGARLNDLAGEPLWRVVQDQPSAARFPDGPDYPGESLAAMSARAVAAIRTVDDQVLAEHGPQALWVAVSHGDVIKAIVADAAGAHLDHFQRIVVNPASLSVVRYTPGRPFVERVNDNGSDLAGLVPPPPQGASGEDAAVGGGA